MSDVLADRYELRRLLGTGGMARVYEGYDRALDRRVAVKVLRDDLSSDPTLPQRLLREARTAARFTHPHAVTVFDTGMDRGRPFIVMELVEGRTLADELAERGALPAGEAISIADQVLDALAAAHELGFVHRDVKPGNVLLPSGGGVKLADFGIAKELQTAQAGLTATGTVLGTPRYLAPELVAGEPAVPATDVYAVGVVLYEMLAGEPPFDGDNPIAVAMAHQRDPVPPLAERRPDLDPDLIAVVERALAKDPAERFPDAAAMRSALLDLPGAVRPLGPAAATTVALPRPEDPTVLLDEPQEAPAPPAPARRRGGRVALIGLVVLALLALALFAATRGGDGQVPDATPTPTAPTADDEGADAEPPADAVDPGADEAPADDAQPAQPQPDEQGPAQPQPPAGQQPNPPAGGGQGGGGQDGGQGQDGDQGQGGDQGGDSGSPGDDGATEGAGG